MKAIIIDDDAASIEVLAEKLKKYDDIQLVGTATNAAIGINLAKEIIPDVAFLDIELPDMSGVDFLERMLAITGTRCRVVMYTAYPQYMLPAFRNKAFDYLLKPIDDAELDTIVERLRNERSTDDDATQHDDDGERQKKDGKMLLYTNSIDFRLVQVRDIGLFQYNHELRAWEVIVAGRKKPIKLKRNVNNEALLTIDTRFVQVSQRFIINIDYLLEVNDNVCRFYPPFDEIDYVKAGRFFRKRLIDRFCSL